MLIVREVMHCKPGKVKPMVEKFLAMSKLMRGMGMPGFRVSTDVSGAPFWTVVAEMEVEDFGSFQAMEEKVMGNEAAAEIMAGYHDLVDRGCRELYRLAG